MPPSLKIADHFAVPHQRRRAEPQPTVMLNGQAPAGGAVVSLTSNSTVAQPPATATCRPASASASDRHSDEQRDGEYQRPADRAWNGVSTHRMYVDAAAATHVA